MANPDRENPMRPILGTLAGVKELADDIKLFQVELNGERFDYAPGQFAFLSAFGVGEAPFGLASIPSRTTALEFAVNRVGTVTDALHKLEPGAIVGVRGPMGNSFPLDDLCGKDILVLGGGIGGAPLRPVIHTILDHRAAYGHLSILWAARSPSLLVFTDEYGAWRAAPDTELHVTVDRGDEAWQGNVGLITDLLARLAPAPDNTVAIICGPPIMIKFVVLGLQKLGFQDEQMIMTLEAKMKCGIGKCGRCNMGEQFVCLHGPVFSYAAVSRFLESFV
ncbi:MAG TPA: FAD/NAD(P)-binding protein [Anaerolineae bacterium]|nr:FAD/NAD(P)-binding protein [Anaerolineae bacterium]